MPSLESYRRTADRLKAKRAVASLSVDKERKALAECEKNVRAVMAATEVTNRVAREIQRRVHERIAGIVSNCLVAVFDDPYGFSIRFDIRRGKTEARMVFSRDGVELDDPLNEVGGGVIDVAALALRVASIVLGRPPRRRLLVLDEPFRNVRGLGNKRRVRRMLERLADDSGFQVLLNVDVDAYPEFRMGKVIELTKRVENNIGEAAAEP